MARSFRICRERRTRAGIALKPVDSPFAPGAEMVVHAESTERALANARAVLVDTRNLVAIPLEN